jgi:hypothetical protein
MVRFFELEPQFLLSGGLNYINRKNLKVLKDDTKKVESMLTLEPLTP